MKDRLLGMSLSYSEVGNSLVDPLTREEVYFKGDPAMDTYLSGGTPFLITSATGLEPQRNVVENAPPSRIQNREITVYIRSEDPEIDMMNVIGKYISASDSERYSLNAVDGTFYVPTSAGGSGMITLTLLMGDGSPQNVKRYQAKASIKSFTGDMYTPSNDIYVLVLVLHDASFLRYEDPFRVTWNIPWLGGFVSANGSTVNPSFGLPVTKLPDTVVVNRLTRPRITIEATAVESNINATQGVRVMGYYRDPTIGIGVASFNNSLTQIMNIRRALSPTENFMNVGEKTSIVIHDPFNPEDQYIYPRKPLIAEEGYYFDDGFYKLEHRTRGFEYMNFPVGGNATVKITGSTTNSGGSARAGANVDIHMDFFDYLFGVVM